MTIIVLFSNRKINIETKTGFLMKQARKESRIKSRRLFIFDWKFILVVLIGVLFGMVWMTTDRKEEIVEESIKTPVYVSRAERGTLRDVFTISGYVESEAMVTILPKISGSLIDLRVDMGDLVEKGQLLGVVDSEVYQLQLKQAEAAYLAYQSTYERVKKLYESRATSQQNYDEVKAQYDATKAQYDLARLQYSYTDIISPVRGVVLVKHTSVGSLVAPQVPVVTIGDLDRLIVKAKIPEAYYYFFQEKQNEMKIEAVIPALQGQEVLAEITKLSPYISPETKNFETVCRFSGDSSRIRPGMFIEMSFIMNEKKGVWKLPYTALVGGDRLWYVDEEDGLAKSMRYQPVFGGEDEFELPGEYSDRLFITEGQHFLSEGHELKILNEKQVVGGEAE